MTRRRTDTFWVSLAVVLVWVIVVIVGMALTMLALVMLQTA